jgi:flagellar protein FlbT
MPLSIPLPAGAKIIINGAVIENSGSANITLAVHNKANILRDKDVLTQAEADTPAKEIYHSIQNAYLFENNRQEWLDLANLLMEQFALTWPAALPTVQHLSELMADDKLYNALRASRRLIAIEGGEVPEPPPKSAAPRGPQKPQGPAPTTQAAEPGTNRQSEIGSIKDKIAELEKRIAALDQTE